MSAIQEDRKIPASCLQTEIPHCSCRRVVGGRKPLTVQLDKNIVCTIITIKKKSRQFSETWVLTQSFGVSGRKLNY